MTRRARIALLTHDDPEDRRTWSGISHFMAAALQRHCGDVVPLGPIRSRLDAVGRYLDRASRRLSGKKYDYGHSVILAKRYGAIIQSRLAREACDLIVAGSASTDIAFLDTAIPIVYASGTTFRLIHNYYPDYSDLAKMSSREGHLVEGRAIQNASLLVYPSAWAARSAVEGYGAEAAKVHVVPFGANLEEIPSREAVLARKRSERCQLLFLGVDWVRKGGDIAFATLRRLEERGIQADLVVCGCVPPPGIQHDRMTVIPFLDKSVDAERRELAGLLFTSDFLLLPTRSECFGIVFCEASAFGLPAITTDTGGVSGAVRQGENGFRLPPSAGGPEYADLIERLYRDGGRYDALVRSSRAAFDTRLNWDAWGLEMSRLISQVLPSHEGGVSGWKNRGGAAAPTRAQEVAAEDVARRYEDYPLLSRVEAARRLTHSLEDSFRATGMAKSDYLRLADGVVRYFAGFQNKRGAIIDPYERAEKQYATPAFACAAAVLYASGYNTGLLAQCLRALDWAIDSLASGRAADGHADFYTLLLMHALHALRGHIAPGRLAGWQRRLGTISAKKTYTFQPDSPELHNWNLAAVSGEWMRYRAGLLDILDWIEASLSRQMAKFTPYGMYQDPGDPLAYDTFARYCVVNLLEQGYSGRHAAMLDELMTRGAWTSLFLQSPQGEIPCGGRSGHHQWIEAAHAMICEVYARRLSREGNGAAAGAFKRSARLALQSIARWVRPSGDLWIVKNKSDPALRHGYESYSFHSQYNLLTAAALATAHRHADDSVEERPCPAEIGGFALAIQPAFHKVFANAGGLYLEIDTRADAQYNPTGLLRIHRRGVLPQVSVSDGVSAGATYGLPTRPTRSLALGPGWRGADGVWHSLAAHDGTVLPDAEVRIGHESPDRVEFSVAYGGGLRGGATQVKQLFTVTPFRVEVTDVVGGPITGCRQYFPLFATDGERSTSITMAGRQAAVQHPDGSRQEYGAEGEGSALVRLGIPEPSRNGALDAAYVESATSTMRCAIRPIAAGESGSGSTG